MAQIDMQPPDAAEAALVDRIADCAWRLRRFPAVEPGLYTATYLRASRAPPPPDEVLFVGFCECWCQRRIKKILPTPPVSAILEVDE